jgi:hypothetical protein
MLGIVLVFILPLVLGLIIYVLDSRAVVMGVEALSRLKVLAACTGAGLLVSIALLYSFTLFQIPSRNETLVTFSQLLTYNLYSLALVSCLGLLVAVPAMVYFYLRY